MLLCENPYRAEMSDVNLSGEAMIRADRNINTSWKSIDCGFCVKWWDTRDTVYKRSCTHDYEILVVSFYPLCLPREFGQIRWTEVGLCGSCSQDRSVPISWQTRPVARDFNSCVLSIHLPFTTLVRGLSKLPGTHLGVSAMAIYQMPTNPPAGLLWGNLTIISFTVSTSMRQGSETGKERDQGYSELDRGQ